MGVFPVAVKLQMHQLNCPKSLLIEAHFPVLRSYGFPGGVPSSIPGLWFL